MKEVKVFDHAEFGSIRTVEGPDGEPWFVARGVALALGYSDPADAIQRHCKKSNDFNIGVSPSGVPAPKIIPESDVYRLIMRSNLPDAERFRDWVVEEVLPSIRKHGGYLTPAKIEEALLNPDTLIRLATDLKAEREKRKALEARVEADRPKVAFAEAVESSTGSINLGIFAKFLKQNGIDIGQNRLFRWLRSHGWLMRSGRDNVPTQRGMDMKLFDMQEIVINTPDGGRPRVSVKITGKGQTYFMGLFKGGHPA